MIGRKKPYKMYDVIIKGDKFYRCRIVGETESLFQHVIPTLYGACFNCGEPDLIIPTNMYLSSTLGTHEGRGPYYQLKYPVIGNMEPGETVWCLETFRRLYTTLFIKFIAEVALVNISGARITEIQTGSDRIPSPTEPKCSIQGECVPAVSGTVVDKGPVLKTNTSRKKRKPVKK